MPVGRRFEVDREPVAVRYDEVRAHGLARVEDGLESSLHLGRLEDLARDERLWQTARLAEARSETVGVQRDARGVRAVPADLPGLGLEDDRRLPRLRDAEQDDRRTGLREPVPVLPAVGVAIGRGLGKDREGRAAFGFFVTEWIAMRELAARVEGKHLVERDAGSVGDASELIRDAGKVGLDRRDPPRYELEDLGPVETGGLLERLLVERDRRFDLLAGRLAMLAP